VLLLDADIGLGNVDVLLGLTPDHDLRDVILHGKTIQEVVVDGPWGLKILPGAAGVEELLKVDDDVLKKFLADLEEYCAAMDFVVIDCAPGISTQVINCLLAADEVILVSNPEPMARTDAYALLKVLSSREEARGKRISVIMNQASNRDEGVRSFDRIRSAAKRFLNWDIQYLGSVAKDESVSEAAKRQVDFITHYTASPCSRDVRKIAARLLSEQGEAGASVGRFFRALVEGSENE
jgi:flagellar biosynthesis protein FlhG